jgi:hypothetical protein
MIFYFKHSRSFDSKICLHVNYNELQILYEICGIDPFGGNSTFQFYVKSIEDVKEFIDRNFIFRGLILDRIED